MSGRGTNLTQKRYNSDSMVRTWHAKDEYNNGYDDVISYNGEVEYPTEQRQVPTLTSTHFIDYS